MLTELIECQVLICIYPTRYQLIVMHTIHLLIVKPTGNQPGKTKLQFRSLTIKNITMLNKQIVLFINGNQIPRGPSNYSCDTNIAEIQG